MVKGDFGNLGKREKAEYINRKLNEGMSLKDIYNSTLNNNELTKSKESLVNQFNRAGYNNNPAPGEEKIRLDKLLEVSDDILDMLTWWKNNNKVQNSSIDNRLAISLPTEGEYVRKTIRINKEIWEEWKAFCSQYPTYTEKDLLTKALLFFMKK